MATTAINGHNTCSSEDSKLESIDGGVNSHPKGHREQHPSYELSKYFSAKTFQRGERMVRPRRKTIRSMRTTKPPVKTKSIMSAKAMNAPPNPRRAVAPNSLWKSEGKLSQPNHPSQTPSNTSLLRSTGSRQFWNALGKRECINLPSASAS